MPVPRGMHGGVLAAALYGFDGGLGGVGGLLTGGGVESVGVVGIGIVELLAGGGIDCSAGAGAGIGPVESMVSCDLQATSARLPAMPATNRLLRVIAFMDLSFWVASPLTAHGSLLRAG
jgi:hypothetical protein